MNRTLMPGHARYGAILAGLLALGASPAGAQTAAPCVQKTLQARKVVVCAADAGRTAVRLLWKDDAGAPYGSLRGIGGVSSDATGPMLFAMNAGMYHRDLSPVGLYIERGRQLVPASTASGPGNFHLRPNGVFFVSGSGVGVLETRRFLARGAKADFATQSGPMLVIDGKLHPKFTGKGQSRKIRNGVGVRGGQQAFFVITEEPVTFSEFARMFRDDLGTPNALYLDGSISSLYAPSVGRADGFLPVGPIVAVYASGR
jgi:uncharacterized protein YigE (DUF2233 family)